MARSTLLRDVPARAYGTKRATLPERRAREPAAADRERIARRLHDAAGRTLYGIGSQLQDILCEVTDPALVERLESLRALASRGVAEVRSAVYALSVLHVREHGFVPSLRVLVEEFQQATGVGADLRIHGGVPCLGEAVERALHRMAHEALAGVERHARATGVVVSLSVVEGAAELSIRDDGVGLDQRLVPGWQGFSHVGLRAVAKAIEEVGGGFTLLPVDPRGLHARARVPLRAASATPMTGPSGSRR